MTIKKHAKFEEEFTCCFKTDMRNFTNFHQSTRKFHNWDFGGILSSKVKNV